LPIEGTITVSNDPSIEIRIVNCHIRNSSFSFHIPVSSWGLL